MTFMEKFLAEKQDKVTDCVMEFYCPYDVGFEKSKDCDSVKSCAECWQREVPEMLTVKINLHGSGTMPEQHGEYIDLYTAENVEMQQGEFRIISLGVSMELPKGYYAEIVPRSSTYKNFGVIMTNSVGVIENTYCGAGDVWGFPALAFRQTVIPKGTRLCQFRLVKQAEKVNFVTDTLVGNENRGGFGSTGTK